MAFGSEELSYDDMKNLIKDFCVDFLSERDKVYKWSERKIDLYYDSDIGSGNVDMENMADVRDQLKLFSERISRLHNARCKLR